MRAALVAALLLASTLSVPASAAAPSAQADGFDATEDETLIVAAPGVLANDADADLDPLAAILDTDALDGTVTLAPDGSFTYEPDANFNGTDSFSYHVEAAGESSAAATVTITVAPVNDPPIANDDPNGGCGSDPTQFGGAFPIPEDPRGDSSPYWPVGYEDWFFLFADCLLQNDVDVDGDLLTLEFVGQPAHGDAVNLDDVLVGYRPDPDYSTLPGDEPGGEWISDVLTYRVFDGTAYSDAANVPIWVFPINDPPTFTPGPDLVQVAEDSGPYSGPWATEVSAGPENESYQTVTFEIVNLDFQGFGNLFSVPPAIDSSGVLTFTPAPNGYGAAIVTVRAVDDGGLEEYSPGCECHVPADDTSDETSFAIHVLAVPDAPVADDKVAATDEDTPVGIILTASSVETCGLGIDVSDPAHGALTLSDTTCSPVSCSRQVTYTPDPDYNGPDSFTYTADDGSLASAPATVSISVAAVNDPPSFRIADDQTTPEDVGAVALPGFITDFSPGPGDEASQTLGGFTVTSNSNPSLFSVGPAVTAHGTLTYTSAPNANGAATITIRAEDSDGAVSEQTFTITITAVNDPPNPIDDLSFVVTARSGPTTLDVLANDSFAPDTGETLSIVATSTPAHGSVVITGGGSGLTYQPNAFFEGTDTFTYTISDGGLTDTAMVVVTVAPIPGLTRQWGADRYATAAAISAATFGPGVPVAYIASGTNFPDALAGAAAAGYRGGPVLLANPNLATLPAATASELARLAPQSIVVLGGPGAVPDALVGLLDPYTAEP